MAPIYFGGAFFSTSCLKQSYRNKVNGTKEDRISKTVSAIDNHIKFLRLTAPSFTFYLQPSSSVKAALLLHNMVELQSIQCIPVARKNDVTNYVIVLGSIRKVQMVYGI